MPLPSQSLWPCPSLGQPTLLAVGQGECRFTSCDRGQLRCRRYCTCNAGHPLGGRLGSDSFPPAPLGPLSLMPDYCCQAEGRASSSHHQRKPLLQPHWVEGPEREGLRLWQHLHFSFLSLPSGAQDGLVLALSASVSRAARCSVRGRMWASSRPCVRLSVCPCPWEAQRPQEIVCSLQGLECRTTVHMGGSPHLHTIQRGVT